MTRDQLRKIERDIAAARRRSNTHRDLKAIATKLRRVRLKGAAVRGKEPAFVSTVFPKAHPISIPDHGSRNLSPWVQRNVLNDLEGDVLRFEEKLRKEEQDDVQENGGYEN